MQVMTVDIQTGNRTVRDNGAAPDLAPATPPRGQRAVPLKRALQKRLAARRAMGIIAEGAALGAPAGSERPYFKVSSGLLCDLQASCQCSAVYHASHVVACAQLAVVCRHEARACSMKPCL